MDGESLIPIIDLSPRVNALLEVIDEQELGVKSSESLRTTRARLVNQETDFGWYVIKNFRGSDRVDEHLAAYSYLKEAGFPVPEDATRIPDRPNSLAMTDLTQNGRLVVFSGNVEAEQSSYMARPSIQNLDEVRQELREIATKADTLGIIITTDSYFFVYDKDSMRGHVIIGDFGGAVMSKDVAQKDFGYKTEDTTHTLINDYYLPGLVSYFNGGKVVLGSEVRLG